MRKKQSLALVAGAAAMAAGSAVNAAVILTSGTPSYTENFDSIGTAGTAPPANWVSGNFTTVQNNFPAPQTGRVVTAVALRVDDGTNLTRGFNSNVGIAGTNPVTDRALGSIPTTGTANGTTDGGSGDRAIQVAIQNNTGATVTSFNVGYTGEQWQRTADQATAAEGLFLFYSTSTSGPYTALPTALNFNPPPIAAGTAGGLDGNAPANRVVKSLTNVTFASLGLPDLANGSEFQLTWFGRQDAGADPELAIDDVTISLPVDVPEPSVLGLAGVAGLGLLARRRRNQA